MSYLQQLQQNNTNLQNLVAKTEQLPDKEVNPLVPVIEGTATKLTASDLNGVTKIGKYGLSFGPYTEIELPETVTEIGEYAFYKNEQLEKVVLPKNLTALSTYAFANCTNLKDIDISNITTLATNAFYYSAMPDTVVLANGVTKIPDWCFCSCKNMRVIHIPPTVKNIGREAFAFNTGGVFSEIHISDLSAWCNMSVSTFNNDSGAPLYKAQNLYVNGELVTDLVIPDDVTTIKPMVFNGLRFNSLHANHVTVIENKAFYQNKGLINLIIPASVKTLGTYAFGYGADLEYVEVPEALTYFNNAAFRFCEKLKTVKMHSATPPTLGSGVFQNCTALTQIIVPIGAKAAYDSATNWAAYANIIIEEEV
jgi:hypothetical protein